MTNHRPIPAVTLRLPTLLLMALLAACGGSATSASSAPATPSRPAPSLAAARAAAKPSAAASTPPSATASPSAKPAASSAATPQLTIPYTAVSITNAPFWVTLETGQFARFGLDVKTEYIPTSTTLTPAMLSGQVPVANNSEDALINADLAGGDLQIIAGGVEKLMFWVYTKNLNAPADLKGKKLGITKIGAATDFAARFVLSKNNLVPDKDVALIQMNAVPEIMAGVISGAADAGVLSPPTTAQAKKAGLKSIAALTDYDVLYYTGPIVAKKSWLKEHPDLGLKVVQAYASGMAVAHRDKETTMKIIGKYSKTDDQSILEDAYASMLPALPRSPLPKADAIKVGLAQSTDPQAKTADPGTFIDPSFAEQLEKNGFIDALYK